MSSKQIKCLRAGGLGGRWGEVDGAGWLRYRETADAPNLNCGCPHLPGMGVAQNAIKSFNAALHQPQIHH